MNEFIKQHWPKVVIAVVFFVGGLAAGWYAKPGDVAKVKEVVVEKQVTTEAQKELLTAIENLRIEMTKTREVQVEEKYHREELETRLPDGTYTKKVTIDKNIDSHTTEKEVKTEVKVVEVEKKVEVVKTEYVDRVVTKTIDPVLEQWHISALGGVNPQFLPAPQISGVVVVGEVERRIIGPLFIGVWGGAVISPQGAAPQAIGGLKVSGAF